jgi:hypothetical protein
MKYFAEMYLKYCDSSGIHRTDNSYVVTTWSIPQACTMLVVDTSRRTANNFLNQIAPKMFIMRIKYRDFF